MQTAQNIKPTHDAWGKPIWYPQDEPYRVSTVHKSAARLDHGWRHGITKTFATEQEARNFAKTLKAWKVRLDVAENAATWNKNGRWRVLETWVQKPAPPKFI